MSRVDSLCLIFLMYGLDMCVYVIHTKHTLSSLHWRHNDHDCVSNHQPHGCLLNRLFGRRSKKTSKLHVTGLCAGNSPGPVNSPHRGLVTRKFFHLMTSSCHPGMRGIWCLQSVPGLPSVLFYRRHLTRNRHPNYHLQLLMHCLCRGFYFASHDISLLLIMDV